MTVKELKQELSFFKDDQEVFFAYPSGDYWGTTLAGKVEDVEERLIAFSEYHRKHKLVDEDYEDRHEEVEVKEVVILS